METTIKGAEGRKEILLTTERSESCYGMPVAVINGKAYGPGDNPPDDLYNNDPLSWMNKLITMSKEVFDLAYEQHLLDDPLVVKFTKGV